MKGCRSLIIMAIVGFLLFGPGIFQADAATNNWGKVDLYEQNSLGQIQLDGAKGRLDYTATGPRFDFFLNASRLDRKTNYRLILSREPEVMLPTRYQVLATGTSDSGGGLSLSGSIELNMDLLASKILLIPTGLTPDKALTDYGKYLFGASTIAYNDTESNLICGANQSPGPSDQVGLHAGDLAVNFILSGIEGGATLTSGNAEQPLDGPYELFNLLETKPVLLVNGAFT
jgi:hypothetical protein